MAVRVEFRDGTEVVYKGATAATRKHLLDLYEITRHVETETPYSKFFSREVKIKVKERKVTVAFIELSLVAIIEII